MSSRELCPASWLCTREVKIVLELAVKIKLTRFRAQIFTAQPQGRNPKCVKRSSELLDPKRPMSAGMMDMSMVSNVDSWLVTAGASPIPLNCVKCCALSTLRLGDGKSSEFIFPNHDGSLYAKICSFLFTSATRYSIHMPLRSATITTWRHSLLLY